MAKEANKTTVIALLVVAGILLFLVGSYTGNIISVAKGNAGKVYTTTEIDAKLAKLSIKLATLTTIQKQDVLDMLSNCERTGFYTVGDVPNSNGKGICESYGNYVQKKYTCISVYGTPKNSNSFELIPVSCTETFGDGWNFQAICCKA